MASVHACNQLFAGLHERESYTREREAVALVRRPGSCRARRASSAGPVSPHLGEPFAPKAGVTAAVDEEALRVTFDRVATDSRCPQGAQCVSEGEAVVRVRLTGRRSKAEAADLKISPGAQTAEYGRYQVTLLEVEPRPVVGRSIRPADCAITLVVRAKD